MTIEMKPKTCHTIGTVLKLNRTIVEREKTNTPNIYKLFVTILAYHSHLNKKCLG